MANRQDLVTLLNKGGLSIADRSEPGKPLFIILACTCDECRRLAATVEERESGLWKQ